MTGGLSGRIPRVPAARKSTPITRTAPIGKLGRPKLALCQEGGLKIGF